MKTKKIRKAVSLLSLLFLLGSCKTNTSNSSSSPDGEANWHGTLKEGYTSLANDKKAINAAISADGTYTTAGQTFTTKNTYNYYFSTEPDSYNYLSTPWQYNALHFVNMVDGLISNNQYGATYGGLALGYKTTENADGTETWSFQLKEGVKWINNKTGEVYGEVVADDFVAAMEYVLDPVNGSEFSYLPCGVIKNADTYYSQKTAHMDDSTVEVMDFSKVGVKAADKYTIEYTLVEPTPYFLTCLTYSVYYPVSRAWLEEEGTAFGETADNILVNGAFRLTEHVKESKSVFSKNPTYYDVEHVYVDTVKLSFVGRGAEASAARKLYENGELDGFNVQSSDEEGYKKYVTGADGTGTTNNPYDPNCSPVSSTDQFCFISYFNYIRTTYEYASDAHKKTESEKADTNKAILNKNFRKGFLYGLKVMEYLKYYNSSDPIQRLNRTYTVKGLAQDSSGKDYTEYVEDVYNREQGTTGVDLIGTEISEKGSSEDPVYNAAKAKEYFAKAKEELAAAGVTAEHIYIDVIGDLDASSNGYKKEMFKAIQDNSDGWVVMNVSIPTSEEESNKWGTKTNNYDFSMEMGWGADYGDPKSFLHTLVGETFDGTTLTDMGDNLSYLGFTGAYSEKELSDSLLGNYTKLYNEAVKYNTTADYSKRLAAFAEAEYDLIYEDAIVIPFYTRSGIYDSVSKVIPHQAGTANYGNNSDKFTNIIVSDTAITRTQRDAINTEYKMNK